MAIAKITSMWNGWLIKGLITIIFFGITGWVAYNTQAGEKRGEKLDKTCLVVERIKAKTETLAAMAEKSTEQQRQIIDELKAQGKSLAKIEEVMELIKNGQLRIDR